MGVKASQSAARVLAALEKIARHQPVGVSELARLLNADKSATQRAVVTLADEGWIRAAPGGPTRWQLTAHILALAHIGQSSDNLRQRARGVMETLRDDSGETVLLTVPDVRRFVVVEVVESRQHLRMAPNIGLTLPVRGSATGRAVLPYLSRYEQIELLGGPADADLIDEFKSTMAVGYSVSPGDVIAGSTNIGAVIFDVFGHPEGALVVSAPSERVNARQTAAIGLRVLQAARLLSRSVPVLQRLEAVGA